MGEGWSLWTLYSLTCRAGKRRLPYELFYPTTSSFLFVFDASPETNSFKVSIPSHNYIKISLT